MQEVTGVKISYWVFFKLLARHKFMLTEAVFAAKVLMVFPSISSSLGEGTACIDVLCIFCVALW